MSTMPWDPEVEGGVYCAEVIPFFHNCMELSPKMLFRACKYIVFLSKYKHVDVPDPAQVQFLLNDARHVRQYLLGQCKFRMTPWLKRVYEDKKVLFIPGFRNGRWVATVCWAGEGA